MLHVIDCCGQTEDCRETGRCGGNKVEDSGEVGGEQESWDVLLHQAYDAHHG